MPDDVREQAERELGRLERMGDSSGESSMLRTYLDWLARRAVGRALRGAARSGPRPRGPRRRPRRPRRRQGADHRVHRGPQAARRARRRADEQGGGSDPDADRPSRNRQDLDRRVDRPRHRTRVRPHVAGRRPRRGRDPRSPPHLHRRPSGPPGQGPARRRDDEPGDHARRGRQGRRRLARRPELGACSRCSTRPRTTRSGITTSTSSSISPRSCSSPRRTSPRRSRGRCSTGWRSSRFDGYTTDEKVAIARGYLWPRQLERNGLEAGEVEIDDERPRDGGHRVHPGGRRAQARARARQGPAEDGDPRSPAGQARPTAPVDDRRRCRPQGARGASGTSRRPPSGPPCRASPPASRSPERAATSCSSRRRRCPGSRRRRRASS